MRGRTAKKIDSPSRTAESLVRRLLSATTDPALRTMAADDLVRLFDRSLAPEPQPPDSNGRRPQRWQDKLIEELIRPGSSVLDLGCGDGELLHRLITHKKVRGQGVELDPEEIYQCVERGVPVFQANLDQGLRGFGPRSFDYVVLEETLQTLHQPIEVLNEMLRVGRRGIVSFPNFGYWRVRLGLAVGGRMPITERLPYRWYNTPNIHLLSLQDFLDWVHGNGARVVAGWALCEGEVRRLRPADNLHAEEVLIVVQRKRPTTSA